MKNHSRRFLIGLVVVGVIATSSWFRLAGVTQNGVRGSDTYQYLDIAFLWDQGQFLLNNDLRDGYQFFRPTFYTLNVLALRLFNYADYSLRALLGMAESLNIFLAFLVGTAVFQSGVMGLAVMTLYACIPSGIEYSQTELAHTYTVTFTLSAFLCVTQWLRWRNLESQSLSKTFLCLSALFAGLSATTHGSTSFFGPAYLSVILLAIATSSTSVKAFFKEGIKTSAVFTGLFFTPHLIFASLIGFKYSLRALKSESGHRGKTPPDPWELFQTYLSDGPRLSLSEPMMYALWIALAYVIFTLLVRRKNNFLVISSAMIIVLFIGLFSFFLKNVFFPRLFLPLNIFVIITVLGAAWDLTRKMPALGRATATLLLALLLGYYSIKPALGQIRFKYRGEDLGSPRYAWNVLKDRANDQNRLLIGPYIQWSHRPAFKAPVYFRNTASYLIECTQGSVEEFIHSNNIRFVMIARDIDQTIMSNPNTRYDPVGACWGMTKQTYSLEVDQENLRQFLAQRGATLVASSERYGEIFELPNAPSVPVNGQ